jgi:hypothetical protein
VVVSRWRGPRRSASRQLHCLTSTAGRRINLLTTAIRIFPPQFVGGVVDLYNGLRQGDDDLIVHAYETWGFKRLSRELIDALNIWARFIYGPLLEDRVRSLADGIKPAEYGRREAFRVHQALKARGPVTVPREFSYGRAAIGSARCSCICVRAQFPSAVQRSDRGLFDSARHRAPGHGPRECRSRPSRTLMTADRRPRSRSWMMARRPVGAVALPRQLR